VPLYYQGGKIQTKPEVHVVFWGKAWAETGSAPMRESVLAFFRGLSGSPWQGILTQYFELNGSAISYISPEVKVDYFIDEHESASAPTEIGYQKLEEEVHHAATEGKNERGEPLTRGINAQFTIIPAPGSTYESKFAPSTAPFCAYHENFTETLSPTEKVTSTYQFDPYMGSEPFYRYCRSYDSEYNVEHVTTTLASHEYAETVTDPLWNTSPGWKDVNGQENGDICASHDDQLETGNDNRSWVQGTWDDHENACELNDKEPPHLLGQTEWASSSSKHEATLRALVDPEGLETKYYFEYGPTSSYQGPGSGRTEPVSAGNGTAVSVLSQTITGLRPENTYHYRVVVSNAATNAPRSGTADGEDRSVRTSQWSSTQPPSPAGSKSASLSDLSCPSSIWCMALGGSSVGPFADILNGSWSEQPIPLPPGQPEALLGPRDVAVASGGVWVADTAHSRLVEYSSGGGLLKQVGHEGAENGAFKEPWGIAASPKSGNIWVADHANSRVDEFNANGEFLLTFGWGVLNGNSEAEVCPHTSACRAGIPGEGPGQLKSPQGIAVDGKGEVWVTDPANGRLDEFNEEGGFVTQVGSLSQPNGVAVDTNTNPDVWVTEYSAHRVTELSTSTGSPVFARTFGLGVKDGKTELETCTSSCLAGLAGPGNGELPGPAGISVDEHGNLWVVNEGYYLPVQKYTVEASGEVKYGGYLEYPYYAWGVTTAGSALYVADWGINAIWRWSLPAGEGVPTRVGFLGAVGAALRGISCASSTACMTVGEGDPRSFEGDAALAESWNGKEWTAQSIPAPSGTKQLTLYEVSCSSSSECMAVGFATNAEGARLPYSALWKGGTTWTVQSVPLPEGIARADLLGVSCLSASFCMAVGRTFNAKGVYSAFSERWNGSSWSAGPAPSGSVPYGSEWKSFETVSCASASACMAAGFGAFGAAEGFQGMTMYWNGTGWAFQPRVAPTPQNNLNQSGFGHVSCSAPEACTVVGSHELRPYEWGSLIEAWNGSQWSLQPAAVESPGSGLSAVSCVLESRCIAVGGASGKPIALERSETKLAIQTTSLANEPGEAARHGVLSGSSCASSTACVALGAYKTSAGTSVALAGEWNGLEWKRQAPPQPSGASSWELHHVSCTSASECTAVGSYTNGSGTIVTLAETLSAGEWKIQPTPNPTGARESRLSGDSCTSASECTAAGSYTNSSGAVVTLAERLSGGEWKIQPTPNPSGAKESRLSGVSCTSATSCSAVGLARTGSSSSSDTTLAESWNGTEWKIQPTQNPEGGKGFELSGVSCASVSSCTAVGSYINSTGATVGLAESWNGEAWQVQAVENPTGAAQSKLLAVSCGATGSCTAVGSSKQPSGHPEPLAELWNGREWHIWAAPGPSGSEASELQDVSCLSISACGVVGSSINASSKTQESLAEGLGTPGLRAAAATNITQTSATLSGEVAPNQWITSYRFEYGVAPWYGTSVPALEEHLFSEASGEAVQQSLSGLTPNTTYHYRLVATNGVGTTYGADQTFTTPKLPVVTSVQPDYGPEAGATTVTITGANFAGITGVKFGQTNAARFTVESETKITAVSPPGSGTVDVTVMTAGASSEAGEADLFVYGPPSVTNVQPNLGSESGGSAVTISGKNFRLASEVKFGQTKAARFTINSDTSISAVSPPGTGTVDVTVTNPSGTSATSAADQYTYNHLLARAWGANEHGQLGNGTTTGSDVPVSVQGLPEEVTATAAGRDHSLALLKSGVVMAWGANESGQLGNGNTTQSDIAVPVCTKAENPCQPENYLTGVSAIAAGTNYSLAVKEGKVYAWGVEGVLHEGVDDLPTELSGLSGVTAVATTGEHSLALLSTGHVKAWGGNAFGGLGTGNEIGSSTPVEVLNVTEATAVSAGWFFSLALLKNGHVDAWGLNGKGEIGQGYECTNCRVKEAVEVHNLSEVTAISSGLNSSLALLSNGRVKAWGGGESGQLGDGSTADQTTPVEVANITEGTAVAQGFGEHSMAALKSGNVEDWGEGTKGQLGNGAMNNSDVPVVASPPGGHLTAIAGGEQFSLAMGTLVSVTKIEPNSGPEAGGTTATITGANFTGATEVKFGPNKATSFTVNSDTSIAAFAPPGTGTVDVTVTTPIGTSITGAADRFNH
jgi:alpha-tubulin suppressor-like RCC1 family protein/sugar lactone lactonase YvrE